MKYLRDTARREPIREARLSLPSAATMADMEERFTSNLPPELRAAHDKLMGEHRALEREFEELTKNRFDLDAHERFLEKLAAHRGELRQHSAEVHRHADWLHEQREVFHAAHEGHARHVGPIPRGKWGWKQ